LAGKRVRLRNIESAGPRELTSARRHHEACAPARPRPSRNFNHQPYRDPGFVTSCLVAANDAEGSAPPDQTTTNRATYDRIARRYAENQRINVSRNESLFAELEETFLTALPERALVADVGCGPGFDAGRFADRGFQAVGVDLSGGMLAVASKELPGRLMQADMRALPITSGQLDGIWCIASLLHVPDVDTLSVLREFKRVLRRAGTLALVTALGESEGFESVPYVANEQRWFVYRNQENLKGQLLSAGFIVRLDGQVQGNRLWSTLLAEA